MARLRKVVCPDVEHRRGVYNVEAKTFTCCCDYSQGMRFADEVEQVCRNCRCQHVLRRRYDEDGHQVVEVVHGDVVYAAVGA